MPNPVIDVLMLLAAMDEAAENGQFAYLCPGCGNWQVEFTSNIEDDSDLVAAVVIPYEFLAELLNEHRTSCAPFDMLAGLTVNTI